MESVPFLSDSLRTHGSFTACWHVLVVQRADRALPPWRERREARLQDTKEVKEKGFVWQVNAADMPVLAVQRCSVDPKLQEDNLLSLVTMLLLYRPLQTLIRHPYLRAALGSKYLGEENLTCHKFEATKQINGMVCDTTRRYNFSIHAWALLVTTNFPGTDIL